MIRRYFKSDEASAEHICIETAPDNLKNTEKKRNFLFLRYLNFYIQHCSDTCFVAEKDGKTVGYILCCADSNFFIKEFPKFAKRNGARLSQALQCLGDTLIYLPFKKKYPAHLHIDILPEAQRMGYGRQLIDALCENLKAQGKNGVMLAVGKNNKRAVSFYRTTGFDTILSLPGTYILGKKM